MLIIPSGSTRVLALSASIERQAEPEFPEDCEDDERRNDRDELRLRYLLDDDVHVAAQPERERHERRDEHLRGEAVEVLRHLALLDDAMVRGGRHQKDDGERRHPYAREVYVLRDRRQLIEALRQDCDELKAHQRLRARQNDAAFGQSVLDFFVQLLAFFPALIFIILLAGVLFFARHFVLPPDLRDLVGAFAPAVHFQQVPEEQRDERAEKTGRDSRLPSDDLLRRHVQVESE